MLALTCAGLGFGFLLAALVNLRKNRYFILSWAMALSATVVLCAADNFSFSAVKMVDSCFIFSLNIFIFGLLGHYCDFRKPSRTISVHNFSSK
ncbi:hypothetical protein [Geoalkalibacter subterraneus]|uniref:hypothetical protein n=1 Tax=Geoalkalibacter subterraneus TaxID=483547 RepID=UPI001185AE81|nr:hypothetical protein [Geoalkalibacter subterraneus]